MASLVSLTFSAGPQSRPTSPGSACRIVASPAASMNWRPGQNRGSRIEDKEWRIAGRRLDLRSSILHPPSSILAAIQWDKGMTLHSLLLAVLGLLSGLEPHEDSIIQGVVVNGSQGGIPLAGAEVVLRGKDNEFSVVARTTTGQDGMFSFPGSSLGTRELSPDVVYLPGANRQGIHYPGPRLRFDSGRSPVRVQLTAYDAVATPCPLVAEEHTIDIQVNPDVLDVTEVLLISNPSSTTYVGSTDSDMPPTTLSLSIPEGVSHVTFNQEFDGRNFRLVDGRLVTSVPWTPGKRQLAFVYQLPVEHSQLLFSRLLDLPTSRVRLAVGGKCSDATACNLPRITDRGQLPIGFASTGQPLPPGTSSSSRSRTCRFPG